MKYQQQIAFIKKLAAILILLLIFDRGLAVIFSKLYCREPQGESSVTTYLLEKTKEDILIFGSSRASHHYDSKFIAEKLSSTVFNGGKDGIGIQYSSILIPEILSRYSPKLILLDMNCNGLSWKAGKEGNDIVCASLLPYIKKYIFIKQRLKKYNPLDVLKAEVSELFAYNSFPFSLLQHYMGIGQKNSQGYLPLEGSLLQNIQPIYAKDSIVKSDLILKNMFIDFIQLCQHKKVPLMVCFSPMYGNKNTTSNMTEIKEILIAHNVEYFDYSSDKRFDDPTLFYDENHLNTKGVANYNAILLDKINKVYSGEK